MNYAKKKTLVVGFISGPGGGKSTHTAELFTELKKLRVNCELAQEYAKTLVWQGQFDELNNQYAVSMKQYNLLKSMDGKVDIIVTDGSLLHGLYYNRYGNPDNVSNIDKTEQMILEKFHEFNNFVLFLERGDFEYEQAGRIQNEEQAKEIDKKLLEILDTHNISYEKIKIDSDDKIKQLAIRIKEQLILQ